MFLFLFIIAYFYLLIFFFIQFFRIYKNSAEKYSRILPKIQPKNSRIKFSDKNITKYHQKYNQIQLLTKTNKKPHIFQRGKAGKKSSRKVF